MNTCVNATVEIRNLSTNAPTYYLDALLENIRRMVENELNNAPDDIVDSYEQTAVIVRIVKEDE